MKAHWLMSAVNQSLTAFHMLFSKKPILPITLTEAFACDKFVFIIFIAKDYENMREVLNPCRENDI